MKRKNQRGFTLIEALVVMFILLLIPFIMVTWLWTGSNEVNGVDVPCIGVVSDKDPAYRYEVDMGNTVMGVVGVYAAFIPTAFWLFDDFYCPIAETSPRSLPLQ